MRALRYTNEAEADLVQIALYIAHESGRRDIALGFTQRWRDQCRKLASLPGTLGTARPELHPDIRSVPFQGYVIFFRYLDDLVEIVSILEGHRDIDGHFRG